MVALDCVLLLRRHSRSASTSRTRATAPKTIATIDSVATRGGPVVGAGVEMLGSVVVVVVVAADPLPELMAELVKNVNQVLGLYSPTHRPSDSTLALTLYEVFPTVPHPELPE